VFIDLGGRRVIVSTRAGSVSRAEMPGAIKASLDRFIDHEGGSALLARHSLAAPFSPRGAFRRTPVFRRAIERRGKPVDRATPCAKTDRSRSRPS